MIKKNQGTSKLAEKLIVALVHEYEQRPWLVG